MISNASIELRNLDTGIKLSTTASGSGNCSFTSLAPGRYVVRAQAKGLQTTEVDVALGTSEMHGISVSFPVASMSQTTVVTEQAALFDVDERRLLTTLDSETTRELPELNRNLWDVMTVTPGIVGTGTRGAGASPGGGSNNFGTQPPPDQRERAQLYRKQSVCRRDERDEPIQNGNLILAPVPDAVQEVPM